MSVFGKPSERELAMERALWAGNVAMVEALLELEPTLVTDLNYMNWTWLMDAIGVSSVAAVRLFLGRGAEVNVKSNDGESPIHLAVQRNQSVSGPSQLVGDREDTKTIVRMLADRGADLNVRGFNDWTPLHRAVSQGDVDLIQLLIELGADPMLRTHIGDCSTPLDDAEGGAAPRSRFANPDQTGVMAMRTIRFTVSGFAQTCAASRWRPTARAASRGRSAPSAESLIPLAASTRKATHRT
jgi:hypothetical protein